MRCFGVKEYLDRFTDRQFMRDAITRPRMRSRRNSDISFLSHSSIPSNTQVSFVW